MYSFVEVSNSDTSLFACYYLFFDLAFLINHVVILAYQNKICNSFGDKFQIDGDI